MKKEPFFASSYDQIGAYIRQPFQQAIGLTKLGLYEDFTGTYAIRSGLVSMVR